MPYLTKYGTNQKKKKNVYKIFPWSNRMQNLKKIDDSMVSFSKKVCRFVLEWPLGNRLCEYYGWIQVWTTNNHFSTTPWKSQQVRTFTMNRMPNGKNPLNLIGADVIGSEDSHKTSHLITRANSTVYSLKGERKIQVSRQYLCTKGHRGTKNCAFGSFSL